MLSRGQRIGPWTIDGLLAEGATALVYRCVGATGAAAMKVHVRGDPDGLRREADLLASLSHDNLVSLLDSGTHDGAPWMVTELVEGLPVSALIRQPPVPPRTAHAIVGQLARCLDYLHQRGLAHGDIKPDNLVLDPLGKLVVLDLGAADGSEGYRPATAEAPHDRDRFALGVVLHELVTGTRAGPERPLHSTDLVRALTSPQADQRPSLAQLIEALPADRVRMALTATAAADPGPVVVQPREQMGRYRIDGVLGRGGMGAVYAATDPALGRAIALKVGLRDTDAERFRREARAIAQLDHPHVVRILDFGEQDGELFYAMERVDGPDLRAVLLDGPVPPSRAVEWVLAVGSALSAAHAAGISHRDVKPANVLLEGGETPKLADFGLASERGGASVTEGMAGTPLYMAPEQVDGRATGPHTDIHALGVLLYELLEGAPPFRASDAGALMHQILHAERVRPPHAPRHLGRVCQRAMAIRPEDRYPTVDAMLADLRPRSIRWGPVVAVGLLVLVAVAYQLPPTGSGPKPPSERELRAAQRYAGVQQAFADNAPDANAVFEAFVGFPDHAGTRPVARAWLARADRETDRETKVRALSQAWVEATHPDEERAALGQLAANFADHLEWASLSATLRAVDRWHPDLDVSAQRHALAVAHRQPDGDPWIASLLTAADAGENMRPHPPYVDFDGDGTRELLVYRDGAFGLAALDPEMPVRPVAGLERLYLDSTRVVAHPPRVVGWGDGHLQVLRIEDDRAVVEWSTPGDRVAGAASGDVDGDGRPELYLGTDAYSRRLLRLDPTPAGGWRARDTVPTYNSAPAHLEVLDLDGDGDDELLVGMTAWSAYDVRVLDGWPLTLERRRKLGHVSDLVRVGDRLLVHKTDTWANLDVFPPERPFGVPAGLYHLDPSTLEIVRHESLDARCTHSVVGDFDGDGLDDLASRCGAHAVLRHQVAPGSFQRDVLRDVLPFAAEDLDHDGDDELIVMVRTEGDYHAYVLGTGDVGVPAVALTEPRAVQRPDTLDTSGLQSAWERAETVAGMGRHALAAQRFETLARLAQDPDLGSAAWTRAGQLHTRAGDPTAAAEAFSQSRDVDAAVSALMEVHRFADADALRSTPLLATLAAAPVVDVDLARLEADWEVLGPGVEDLPEGGLRFTAGDDRVLARLPLTWDGSYLSIEAQLELDRLEWGGGIDLAVESGDHRWGLQLRGIGGGGIVETRIGCHLGGDAIRADIQRDLVADGRALTLHYSVRPGVPDSFCGVSWPDGHYRHPEQDKAWPVAPGPAHLVVRATQSVAEEHGQVQITLRALTLRGVTRGESGAASPWWHLAAQRPDRALGSEPLADWVAYAARGDAPRAARALTQLDLDDPRVLEAVRVDPDRLAPYLMGADPAGWQRRFSRLFGTSIAMHGSDLRIMRLVTRHAPPQPTGALAVDVAVAWRRQGDLDAARTALAGAEPGTRTAVEAARLAMAAGDPDAAWQAVQTALTHEIAADRLLADPVLRPLHHDPRWQRVTEVAAGKR